ncbi:unnamed protein product, partial [Laminaria digitata]
SDPINRVTKQALLPPSPLRYLRAFIFIARRSQHCVPSSTRVKLCYCVLAAAARCTHWSPVVSPLSISPVMPLNCVLWFVTLRLRRPKGQKYTHTKKIVESQQGG